MHLRRIASGVSLLMALSVLPGSPLLGQAANEVSALGPVDTTSRFDLRSAPRVGLFHFLIDWAAAEADEWPPYAPPIAELETWRDLLDDEEQGIWSNAVDAFAATRGRSLVFDGGIRALRDWAAGAGPHDAIPEADRVIAGALTAALPVYLARWWPAHDRRNRAWIEEAVPGLRLIEEAVVPRLEAAYGGRWPEGSVPVDVVYYANAVGAYSTGGRLTISSVDRDNRAPQGVELVFHEASHTDSLERSLTAAVDAAFASAGAEAPDRFWHDMIFYTSGEITRLAFADAGRPDYRHYGETSGVYARGERWATELPALERHWRPFLHSGSGSTGAREAALEALASALVGQGR